MIFRIGDDRVDVDQQLQDSRMRKKSLSCWNCLVRVRGMQWVADGHVSTGIKKLASSTRRQYGHQRHVPCAPVL